MRYVVDVVRQGRLGSSNRDVEVYTMSIFFFLLAFRILTNRTIEVVQRKLNPSLLVLISLLRPFSFYPSAAGFFIDALPTWKQ